MSSFTRASFVYTGTRRSGRKLWRLEEAMTFEVGFIGSGAFVTVPKGFVTDGPSIPRWAYHIIPTGRMMKSATIHDFMREDPRFDKNVGDAMFYVGMCAENTPAWLRPLALWAVSRNTSREQWNAPADPATGCTGC